MFGDALHTGNEKCQEQNPNCQAVYGPGTLSSVFGWDYFDAIAFLINYNSGYPMTIPDMAKSFQFNGTAGAIAVVDCHNGKWVHVSTHSVTAYWTGDDPKWCNHPQFSMSRDFQLPVLNQIASDVFNRIIPAPNGDCKLIDSASNAQGYPGYNITVSGLPVSIACNLTASTNPALTTVDPNAIPNANTTGTDTDTSTNASPSGASTDNQGGAFIQPPDPVAFATAFDTTNSVCVSGTGNTFCLPNGTYSVPTGLFGYSFSGANAVSMPAAGCNITLETSQPTKSTFTTSQTAGDAPFTSALASLVKSSKNKNPAPTYSVFVPASITIPPAACFFTQTQYLGDVFCFGPGGANFSGTEANVARSVAVYGGATAWVYAAYYGDTGGQKIAADVPDLGTEPYGTGGNFSERVVGAWIIGAT